MVYFTWSMMEFTRALVTAMICTSFSSCRSLDHSSRRLLQSVACDFRSRTHDWSQTGIGLRLAFAVQIPVLVCAAGMVLVENQNREVYDEAVEAFQCSANSGADAAPDQNGRDRQRHMTALATGKLQNQSFHLNQVISAGLAFSPYVY